MWKKVALEDKSDGRWINKLRARRDKIALDKYENSTCPTTSVRRGPVDTIILGDSIIKYVDEVRHSRVISYPGITCSELEQLIIRDKISNLSDNEVIGLHVGTNDLDMHWRSTVHEISRLLVSVTDKCPNSKVVWSNILPRPAATEHVCKEDVRTNIIKINKAIKANQRHLKVVTLPSHTSFHQSKFPTYKLFAIDYLHLKTKGTFLLRELYRQHFIRLRRLWGLAVWEVDEIPIMETIVDTNWHAKLCSNTIVRCTNY